MNCGKPNASAATGTKNRVSDPAPSSGICSVCLDGCPGICEIGKSSIRSGEVLYPQPFGKVTEGAVKEYPVNYSHLNIQGTCIGAIGMYTFCDRLTIGLEQLMAGAQCPRNEAILL